MQLTVSLKLVNWNVEWSASPKKRSEILNRLYQHKPEIICLTETHDDMLSRDGHIICSRPDYGYPIKKGRRKVLLWSRQPWHQVDDVGIDSMPPGRFVLGVTQTSIGDVTVMGVCIPWSGSRTRGSEPRRKMWEDHEHYLTGLAEVLHGVSRKRLIVMGDFNQRIQQGSYVPRRLRSALQSAIASRITIATAALGFDGRRTIDHIALSGDLAAESLEIISNIH